MVRISALVLLIAYFGLAGLVGIRTLPSVINRITNYKYWESFLNPRGLNEQLSEYMLYSFPGRDGLIRNFHSALQVAMGKRESRNFLVIKDDAGFLNDGNFYHLSDYNNKIYASRLRTMKRSRLDHENCFLLAIAGGDKYLPLFTPIYSGYPMDITSHRDMDEMLLRLMEYRVENLDLRLVFNDSALDYADIYSKTDRGWSVKAALEAAGAIAEYLGEKNGFAPRDRDFLMNSANYREIPIRYFEGSYTRSVGHYFGGHDDNYVVMLPRFDTSFEFYDSLYSDTPVKKGSFNETLFNWDYATRAGEENISPVFMGGISARHPVRRVVNNYNPEGAKVLFVGGNDFVSTAAYFALLCGELIFMSLETPNFDSEMRYIIEDGGFNYMLYGMEIDAIGEALFPFYSEN